jgi:penicillin-binding protein 1A
MEERPLLQGWRERLGGARAWLRALLARRRVRLGLAIALSCLFGLSLLLGVAWRTCFFGRCPDVASLTAFRPGAASLVLDRAGRVVSQLVPADYEMVRLQELPAHVPAAFVAIEDRRFFDHGALDPRRIAGAVWANLRSRGFEQGFSTLTMQLARNLFPEEIPGSQRTTLRKLLEIRTAQEIEARFSKPEILELYLNHIYYGNGVRGLGPAARHYFGTPAARLTLAQAALLAALPKAPTRYDPRLHPDRALARRNLVLARMAAQGKAPRDLATAAAAEPLGVHPPSPASREPSPTSFARYFVQEVRRELEERFGDQLYARPVRVWTTLDVDAQRAAEQELTRQLRTIEAGKLGRFAGAAASAAGDRLEGAVVMLAAGTGDVLAWVGGRDFAWSRFDRVSLARRQAGSAWKPFVYAAALENGYALSQLVDDTPLSVPLGNGEVYQPRNFDGTFAGPMSLREALVRSQNVPTVRLALAVGLSRVAELARRTGIRGEVPILPSMPLGTLAVSPLELTRAYTAFAALGQEVEPRLVLRVETADGRPVWTAPPPQRTAVLDPAVSFLLDDALREALNRGSGAPGSRAVFARAAAGKTGTSTGGDDLWFVGYTPDVVAGVWIGFDRPRTIANQATGGRLAAPVWGRLMSRFYAGKPPPQPWPVPAGVVERQVDPVTGLVLAEGCEQAVADPRREYFVAGREPVASCPGAGQEPPRYAFYTDRLGTGTSGEQEIAIQLHVPAPAGGAAAAAGAEAGSLGAAGEQGELPPGATRPAPPAEAGIDLGQQGAALEEAGRGREAQRAPGEQGSEEGAGAAAGRGQSAAIEPGQRAPGGPPGGAGPPGAPGLPGRHGPGGETPAPPADDQGTQEPASGAAAADVSGWWEVTNSVDDTSDPDSRGLRLTYRIDLRQQGSQVSGDGERWAENGVPLPDGQRTSIHLTGAVRGRQVRLQFVEQASRRISGGSFRWRLAGSGERMAGTFASGADARGSSSATRLQ